jgi:hypothetical protein
LIINKSTTANALQIKNGVAVMGGFDNQGRIISYGGAGIVTNFFSAGAGNATLSGANNAGIGIDSLISLTTGFQDFAKALAFNKGIDSLNLSKNKDITDEVGLKELALALATN